MTAVRDHIDEFFDSFGNCTDADLARVAAAGRKLCKCGHRLASHRVLGPCPRQKPDGRRCRCKMGRPKVSR